MNLFSTTLSVEIFERISCSIPLLVFDDAAFAMCDLVGNCGAPFLQGPVVNFNPQITICRPDLFQKTGGGGTHQLQPFYDSGECMYVCMYECMYVCMYVCIVMVYTYVNVYTCINAYIYI